MKAESRFDKKKKERRIAALLALAAEKKSGATRCLTEEEMALLVDGNCSAQEEERGWTHLSDCSECYDQWYVLKMEEKEGHKKSGRVYFMRPRSLAIAGSAMAVAASVAVFLNIPQAPFPDRPAEELLPSLEIAKEAEVSVSQVTKGVVTTDEAVSLREAPSVMYEKMEMEPKKARITTKKKREKIAAAPQSPDKTQGMAGMVMAERAVDSEEEVQSIESWLEMVQEGCLKRRTEEKFWSEIIFKGDQLFHDTEPGADLKGKGAEAFVVFQLIPRNFEKDLTVRRCELILAELAEGEKSR